MRIVSASLRDLDDIMALIGECMKAMEAQGIDQWNEDYPALDCFEEDIQNQSLYILQDHGECLGIIAVNEDQSPEYHGLNWKITDGKVLVVHRLAVHPFWQKQGLGRRLMDFAETFASERGYRAIRLDAYSGNPAALSLYERRGYMRVGELVFPRRTLKFFGYEKAIGELE